MDEPDDVVDVELAGEERFMLDRGLVEWSGPAHCTDALAIGLGFADAEDLLAQVARIRAELDAGRALTRWDWSRALLATEIVFASDVMGAGVDWPITTGLDDARSIQVLRALQRKLAGIVVAPEGR